MVSNGNGLLEDGQNKLLNMPECSSEEGVGSNVGGAYNMSIGGYVSEAIPIEVKNIQ